MDGVTDGTSLRILGRFADAWANGGVPGRSEAMRVELVSIQQRVEREHKTWARKEMMLKSNLGKAEAEVSTPSPPLLEKGGREVKSGEGKIMSGHGYQSVYRWEGKKNAESMYGDSCMMKAWI